jgi:hypothetical protein
MTHRACRVHGGIFNAPPTAHINISLQKGRVQCQGKNTNVWKKLQHDKKYWEAKSLQKEPHHTRVIQCPPSPPRHPSRVHHGSIMASSCKVWQPAAQPACISTRGSLLLPAFTDDDKEKHLTPSTHTVRDAAAQGDPQGGYQHHQARHAEQPTHPSRAPPPPPPPPPAPWASAAHATHHTLHALPSSLVNPLSQGFSSFRLHPKKTRICLSPDAPFSSSACAAVGSAPPSWAKLGWIFGTFQLLSAATCT